MTPHSLLINTIGFISYGTATKLFLKYLPLRALHPLCWLLQSLCFLSVTWNKFLTKVYRASFLCYLKSAKTWIFVTHLQESVYAFHLTLHTPHNCGDFLLHILHSSFIFRNYQFTSSFHSFLRNENTSQGKSSEFRCWFYPFFP